MGGSLSKQELIEYMRKGDITHLGKYMNKRNTHINEHSFKFSCECKGIHNAEPFALIHFAAAKCSPKMLLLLDRANVNEPTSTNGYTPLMLAVMHNKIENIKTLCDFMKCGRNCKDTTPDENTALHLACKYGYEDIVQKLLELGADPTVLNKHGKSAKNVALYHEHEDIASLFKDERNVKIKRINYTVSNTLLLNEIHQVKEELKVIRRETLHHENNYPHVFAPPPIETYFDTKEITVTNRRKASRSESCRVTTTVKRPVSKTEQKNSIAEQSSDNISFDNDQSRDYISYSQDGLSSTHPKFRISSSKDDLETGSMRDVSMFREDSMPYIDDAVAPTLTSSPVSKQAPSGQYAQSNDIAGADSAVDVADDVISDLHHYQIRNNYEELIRMMKPDPLITKFYTIGDFDDDDRDHLHSLNKKTEKNKFVLKEIQNGTEKMFYNFLNFLEGTNQGTLVKIIQNTKGPVPKSCQRTFNERRSQSELNLPTFTRAKEEEDYF